MMKINSSLTIISSQPLMSLAKKEVKNIVCRDEEEGIQIIKQLLNTFISKLNHQHK